MPEPNQVPDVVSLDVEPGLTVLVASDIHFAPTRTEASAWAAEHLSARIRAIEGPAILVFAGDLVEAWAVMPADVPGALDAHPEFIAAVQDFASQSDRQVYVLPGNHDGRLGWSSDDDHAVAERLHAKVAFAIELALRVDDADRRVRIEHGHRFDPSNAFHDPRNPDDTPLGQHVVQELLPDIRSRPNSTFLDGVESLFDPRSIVSFVTSRIFYRRVLGRLWWFLVPLGLVIGLRLLWAVGIVADDDQKLSPFAEQLLWLDVLAVIFLSLMVLVAYFVLNRAWSAASTVMAEQRGKSQNDLARQAAGKMIGDGFDGLVSGHTHCAELSAVDGGFYGNSGSGVKSVMPVRAHFRLPHVYVPHIQVSWIELDTTPTGWHVHLLDGWREVGGTTALERRFARRQFPHPSDPSEVATYP
ncbi:MAG: metallophosphoesterase [Acidimicrobiia bacterium]